MSNAAKMSLNLHTFDSILTHKCITVNALAQASSFYATTDGAYMKVISTVGIAIAIAAIAATTPLSSAFAQQVNTTVFDVGCKNMPAHGSSCEYGEPPRECVKSRYSKELGPHSPYTITCRCELPYVPVFSPTWDCTAPFGPSADIQ